jgi:hypothetical protein
MMGEGEVNIMKVVFDAAKLHDEVVSAITEATKRINLLCDKYEKYKSWNDQLVASGLAESCDRDISLIEQYLVILYRIRDVTAMSSMRDITLSEEEIDIIRKYTRSDTKC